MGTKKHGSKKEGSSDNSKKEPQRFTWKSKYEQICATHVTNGLEEEEAKEEEDTKRNALDGLSGYLSSEDSSSGESELNEEVQSFLKEVDKIYEEDGRKQMSESQRPVDVTSTPSMPPSSGIQTTDVPFQYDQTSAPTVAWQECYDSNTGFTYYWNMETNEVTWDMPPEYQSYMEALKQWQQYQAQGVAALLQARVQQQLQQQQQQQQQLLLQQAQSHQQPMQKNSTGKKKKRPKGKQSDSEEEKIELITSYGPFSGDESSDTEKALVKPPKAKKKKIEPRPPSPKVAMGPAPPPGGLRTLKRLNPRLVVSSLVPYHPDNDDSDADDSPESSKSTTEATLKTEEEKTLSRSPKEDKEVDKVKKPDSEKSKSENTKDEDELALLDRLRSQTQVLKELGGEIPDEVRTIIIDSEKDESTPEDKESKNLKLKLSARAKKLLSASATTAKARATDFIQTADGLKPIEKTKEDEGEKKKGLWQGLSPAILSEGKGEDLARMREAGNRVGFGFVASSDGSKRTKTEKIAFVKADVLLLSEEDKGTLDKEDDSSDEPVDVKDLGAVLGDKLKFLSEGKEPVPPVQVWAIQLETLMSAWETKNLKRSFLEDWLTRTSKEIENLELSVAPDGWVCEWQRTEKRYQYRKTQTGETTWEFPATATGGGEEEMDLSTTPPPPPSTPPPPDISVPSPPSPPKISCDSPPPIPDEVPPLPEDVPPLPPLPPPKAPTPPPPPPVSPPPVHPSQPLPPGVDPPDLPPLPPSAPDYPPLPAHPPKGVPPPLPHQRHPPVPLHTAPLPTSMYPQYYPAYPPHPQPPPHPPVQPPRTVSEPMSQQVAENTNSSKAHDLSSELDSFYSDLATLEPEALPPLPTDPPLPSTPPPPPVPSSTSEEKEPVDKLKKKKKTKLAPGLSLKKKGVSSLVAKWQQVQEDVKRDFKHE